MRILYPDVGLACLCQLLGYSRQAFYKSNKAKDERLAFHCIVAELVDEIRHQIGNHRLGARKLLPLVNEQLEKQARCIGRDQLFDIMDSYGLKVRQSKRRKPQTTDNTHSFQRYANLVKGIYLQQAEQVVASDITYLQVKDKFMYLSLITDMWSRKIMGYSLHEDLSTQGPMKALLMAISNRQYPGRNLIHHSDQGVQYCSHSYINMLKTHAINISMAAKGSPHENALAERVNGILKLEYGLGKVIDSPDKARKMVQAAVYSYNCKRPHHSLAGQTPQQVHGKDKWQQDLPAGVATQARIKQEDVNSIKD